MAEESGRIRKASSAKGNGFVPERARDDNWRDTRTSAQCLSYLFLSEHLSDISFTFSADRRVKLPAHKFVLSMRSTVFEAMFYGSLSEGGKTVSIEDVEPDVMKVVLQYIYSDQPKVNGNNVLACLYAAKKYDLAGLIKLCSEYLEKNIDADNVCHIHEQAVFYDMKPLQDKCVAFITENATSVLSSPGFLKLSHTTLLNILRKNELESEEIGVFKAAKRWAENQCNAGEKSKGSQNARSQLGEALYQIRFPLMPMEEFAKVVTPSGILTNEELVMLYQYYATKGATPIGKFNKEKRLGASIKVDFKINTDECLIFSGCFLELRCTRQREYISEAFEEGCEYHPSERLDDYQTVYHQMQPRRKFLKIKSLAGAFVCKVGGITAGGGVEATYRAMGNEIIFTNPIDISDNTRIDFHLKNDNDFIESNCQNENQHVFHFGFNNGCVNADTFHTNESKNIKGQIITIKMIPDGLESITFV